MCVWSPGGHQIEADVILDRTHLLPAALTAGATVAIGVHYYTLYCRPGWTPHGVPSGGSLPGLCYGIAGYIIIAFGVSLSLRRRYPHLQIGSGQTWLRWHIWLSLLCVPIALFHSAFAMRGGLAGLVAILFTIVILSGVYGLILQQIIPRRMTRFLKRETVLEQIPVVFHRLLVEALTKVRNAALAEGWDGPVPASLQFPPEPGEEPKSQATAKDGEVDFEPGTVPLVNFFTNQVRPYLEGKSSALHKAATRHDTFQHVRLLVPESVYETVDDLQSICDERADLDHQRLLHRLLHGWLYVHVPLSIMLIVFLTLHAVLAVRYIAWPFPWPW